MCALVADVNDWPLLIGECGHADGERYQPAEIILGIQTRRFLTAADAKDPVSLGSIIGECGRTDGGGHRPSQRARRWSLFGLDLINRRSSSLAYKRDVF